MVCLPELGQVPHLLCQIQSHALSQVRKECQHLAELVTFDQSGGLVDVGILTEEAE